MPPCLEKGNKDIFVPVFHQSIIPVSLNVTLPGLRLDLAPEMGIPESTEPKASNSKTSPQ